MHGTEKTPHMYLNFPQEKAPFILQVCFLFPSFLLCLLLFYNSTKEKKNPKPHSKLLWHSKIIMINSIKGKYATNLRTFSFHFFGRDFSEEKKWNERNKNHWTWMWKENGIRTRTSRYWMLKENCWKTTRRIHFLFNYCQIELRNLTIVLLLNEQHS